MSKFKIYKASAGSGKTFSLVYEYLKILIQNPGEYKHILAVTFTNDATEEMKSRVLNQLRLLAQLPENSPYTSRLASECNLHIDQIKKNADESLSNILHDYSNFNISTIDTFFQKILRAFAKDIGLSAAYNLQLDNETAIHEVTEKVIAHTTAHNKQSKWLMKAAIEKIEDGKNWNIREELKALFKETFKEDYQIKEEKIKHSFQNENRVEELQQKIKLEMESFENGLVEFSVKSAAILKKFQLTPGSFPYKEYSFYSWIVKLGEKTIAPPGVRFLNALNNVDNWYAKTADQTLKTSVIQAYEQGLNELLNQAYAFYQTHLKKYNSNQLIKQNLSYFVMFEYMVEEMMHYKSENDVLFITDTNQFINEIIGDNDESFIFEKAGNHFHHYLIDEFQDTSQLQWKNFKPLVSNAVSQGYTSLVVGDVKQSIYRFRNGDWRLLHEQAGAEITYHDVIHLKENYRSLENIILFNNTLYAMAPGIVSDIYQQETGEPTHWAFKFNDCYANQEQLVPEKNKNSGGYIKINQFTQQAASDDDEQKIENRQLNELVVDIDDALKRGYQPNQIAILVFTKKEAFAVASHLRKYVEENNLFHKINIVTQSSLTIGGSHTVRLLTAALRFLINKKDEVSLAFVCMEYQQYFLKNTELDLLNQEVFEKIDQFKKNAILIKSLPLQILLEEVIRFFNLEAEVNEQIFLQHFKDAVFDYLKKNADDLPNFMDWWEESQDKFQVEVPQNEKSLQIITIHKSKGLEFDLVFIPFADWNLDNQGLKSDMLWLDLEEEGIKTLPIKYDKKMQESAFNEAYFQTKFYNYLDKLNLLYVATTRAIRELYIYTDLSKNFDPQALKPNIKTIFNRLYATEIWPEGDAYLDVNSLAPNPELPLLIGQKTQPAPAHAQPTMHTLEAGGTAKNIFETLAVHQQATDLRDETETKFEELRQTGILFHQIIAQSQSKNQAVALLNKLFLQKKLSREEHGSLLVDVENLFHHPNILDWFQHYTVYQEYSFCFNNHILQPDMLLVNAHEAIVVDFKTGQPSALYATQVTQYCKAAQAIFNKPVKGYIYYTRTGTFDPIHP
jgi:ATP-dependent helicase/nuclease subunit A